MDEIGDVPAGDGNVFDAGADDVTFGHGDHVRHSIAAVDHRSRQCPLPDLRRKDGVTAGGRRRRKKKRRMRRKDRITGGGRGRKRGGDGEMRNQYKIFQTIFKTIGLNRDKIPLKSKQVGASSKRNKIRREC